ncbi:phage regulatory CII family protein [Providencia rustigianii]|uniref:Phage regulatory protein CII (CP76) n=1 Tax=Providencia rustigianii DSM 4541 TaxID=500637 RepID=D1NZN8_9GAMM|nr:phage regulatory CII family protein [Providencia rustigianii]EFB73304.1 phage regulatory protein CII (CP76) [Providencia rustigianii DSM 4541]SUC26516.1 Phage regulatory protein CII (CP76) [Providencia rustigianii]
MFDYQASKQSHFDDACRAFALSHKGDLVQIAEAIGMNAQMLRNKLNPEQPHKFTWDDLVKVTDVTEDATLIDGLLEQLHCQPSVPLNNASEGNFPTYVLNATAEVGKLASQAVLGGHINSTRSAEMKQSVNNAIRCLALVGVTISARLHSSPALVSAIDTVVGFGQSIV